MWSRFATLLYCRTERQPFGVLRHATLWHVCVVNFCYTPITITMPITVVTIANFTKLVAETRAARRVGGAYDPFQARRWN